MSIRYSNYSKSLKTFSDDGSTGNETLDTDTTSTLISEIRENLKEKYGWLSPSEYYNGSSDQSSGLSRSLLNEVFDGTISSSDMTDFKENYFWCDTLSNWLVFKYTEYLEDVSYKKSFSGFWGTIIGKMLRTTLAFATGGWSEIMNSISLEGISSWRSLGTYVSNLTLGPTLTSVVCDLIDSGRSTLRSFSSSSYLDLVSTMLWNIISGTILVDVSAEYYYDELLNTNNASMPRNCISLYMWNGFFCCWIPVTAFISHYDKYCKTISEGNLRKYVKSVLISKWNSLSDTDRETYLIGWCNSFGISTSSTLYSSIYYAISSSSDPIGDITSLIYSDSEITETINKQAARLVYLNGLGMDPEAFMVLKHKSPLSKLQMVPINNGDSGTWSKEHHLESWTKWIPLINDNTKIQIYVSKTNQLISRPFTYIGHNERDQSGWIYKSIGHPCFFRGNDNILWICTWKRWTSSRGDRSGKIKGLFRKTGSFKVPPTVDIYEEEVEDWNTIISAMFSKHDDYGFSEWLMNGDYGIAYDYFTIDEETPDTDLERESDNMEYLLNPDSTLLSTIAYSSDIEDHELVIGLSVTNELSIDNNIDGIPILHKY